MKYKILVPLILSANTFACNDEFLKCRDGYCDPDNTRVNMHDGKAHLAEDSSMAAVTIGSGGLGALSFLFNKPCVPETTSNVGHPLSAAADFCTKNHGGFSEEDTAKNAKDCINYKNKHYHGTTSQTTVASTTPTPAIPSALIARDTAARNTTKCGNTYTACTIKCGIPGNSSLASQSGSTTNNATSATKTTATPAKAV